MINVRVNEYQYFRGNYRDFNMLWIYQLALRRCYKPHISNIKFIKFIDIYSTNHKLYIYEIQCIFWKFSVTASDLIYILCNIYNILHHIIH
jgi:hypothetical protein